MKPLTVHVPPLHAAQLQVAQDPHRFRVVCAGRRWGKSRLAAILCVLEALAGKRAWWVAPSYPMAETAWRELKDLASQAGAEVRESDRALIFPRGGFVRVKSSDKANSLRGEGLDFVVIDEAGFQSEDTWTNELRPALADRLGRALIISTPNGRDWFSRLYNRGQDPNESEWASWQFPTASNPFIAATEIAQAERDMPARRFEQEMLATFTDDAGGVFRGVRACATAEPLSRAVAGRKYVVGVDWGRSVDFTVMAVFDAGSGAMVALDRSNKVEYAVQRGRLLGLCDRFRPSVVLAEENSIGAPIIESLVRDGVPVRPFVTSNSSKAEIVDALTLAFERGRIKILPDPVLIAELEDFEMTRLPSGLMRYAAPEGAHDDCVMACALGWYAMSGGGQAGTHFLDYLTRELVAVRALRGIAPDGVPFPPGTPAPPPAEWPSILGGGGPPVLGPDEHLPPAWPKPSDRETSMDIAFRLAGRHSR